MAIVTRSTVKKYLQITSSQYDELIDSFIPAVEADFLIIRGIDFDIDSNDDIEYPDNAEFVASQMIGYMLKSSKFDANNYSQMKSESIGDYSYTRGGREDMLNGYPLSIVNRIERYHNPKT